MSFCLSRTSADTSLNTPLPFSFQLSLAQLSKREKERKRKRERHGRTPHHPHVSISPISFLPSSVCCHHHPLSYNHLLLLLLVPTTRSSACTAEFDQKKERRPQFPPFMKSDLSLSLFRSHSLSLSLCHGSSRRPQP
jgi:hypothetical protein